MYDIRSFPSKPAVGSHECALFMPVNSLIVLTFGDIPNIQIFFSRDQKYTDLFILSLINRLTFS